MTNDILLYTLKLGSAFYVEETIIVAVNLFLDPVGCGESIFDLDAQVEWWLILLTLCHVRFYFSLVR